MCHRPGPVLLALTLGWFLAYRRYLRRARFGSGLLATFLATQALFYTHTVVC